ncbi:MAG: phosphoribosyl 1,2-cyclic phosphodiesterase [Acidimicrobiales bacterium]|jgi:phosphoribosyl 1,2-cyclic phosphodiesterase
MLQVTFYGVRGSTPCSCDATSGFGGNTSCVLVQAGEDDPIIFDCGTGLRYLGADLETEADGGPIRATALVTHLHWDHMQGLPFFGPILRDGAHLTLVGPAQDGESLEHEVAALIRPPFFPVALDDLPGRIDYVEMTASTRVVGSATVTAADVPHIGPTNGYRVDCGNGSVAYLPDHQQPIDGSGTVTPEVLALCADVDILVHDAQYDAVEFEAKATWGHSTPEFAAEVALQAGAKRLVLFHHDPTHDDDWVQDAVVRTQRYVGDRLEVMAANEGLVLTSGSP